MSSIRTLTVVARRLKRQFIPALLEKKYSTPHKYRVQSQLRIIWKNKRMNWNRMMCTNLNNKGPNEKNGKKKKLMPEFRDIRHWDKFEWIFSGANMIQFIGFLSYDYTLLRILSLSSAFGLMIAHTGRKFFVGWFWAFSFFSANLITLYFVFREKYSLDLRGLTDEESFIYETFFKPFTISPLEYKHVLKIGKFITMNRGETLTVNGLICDKVYLLLSGQCVVLNDDNDIVGIISGGHQKSFIGEIALIDDTQDAATATVQTNSEDVRLLYWDVETLKKILKNSKAEFRVKLINVFTTSMKIKLMDSNANFDVEKSIQFKQQNLESIVQMLLISKGKLKIAGIDKCQFINDDNEKVIQLTHDERIFLTEYVKLKKISTIFTDNLMKKYHINL